MTASTCTHLNPASVGTTDSFDLNLQRQAMVSIPGDACLLVRCIEGAVWITLDGSVQDTVLEPGDVFNTADHPRAVLYALKPSRIALAAPAAALRPATRASAVRGRSLRRPLVFSSVWA